MKRLAKNGFTLLEMLAALALIALAGGAAAQLLRPQSPRLRLEAAARALCGTLKAAQARAEATQAPAVVAIDVNAKTYTSSVGGLGRLPNDTTVTLTLARGRPARQAARSNSFQTEARPAATSPWSWRDARRRTFR